jgi:CheY-like chemotaxis protein
MLAQVRQEGRSPLVARERVRVLVVDDDADIRELLVEFLGSEGYDVTSAGDGVEALERARAHRPDVILLDLMMPGMNGWEFREIQRRDAQLADVPVVVISAFDSDLDVDEVLRKPFRVEELLATVERLTA